jgi:hypothetical protein
VKGTHVAAAICGRESFPRSDVNEPSSPDGRRTEAGDKEMRDGLLYPQGRAHGPQSIRKQKRKGQLDCPRSDLRPVVFFLLLLLLTMRRGPRITPTLPLLPSGGSLKDSRYRGHRVSLCAPHKRKCCEINLAIACYVRCRVTHRTQATAPIGA